MLHAHAVLIPELRHHKAQQLLAADDRLLSPFVLLEQHRKNGMAMARRGEGGKTGQVRGASFGAVDGQQNRSQIAAKSLLNRGPAPRAKGSA